LGDVEPRGEVGQIDARGIPTHTSQFIFDAIASHVNGMSDTIGVHMSSYGHVVH